MEQCPGMEDGGYMLCWMLCGRYLVWYHMVGMVPYHTIPHKKCMVNNRMYYGKYQKVGTILTILLHIIVPTRRILPLVLVLVPNTHHLAPLSSLTGRLVATIPIQ